MRFVRCKDRITGAGRQRRAKAEKRAATTTASSAETAAAAAAKTLAPSSRSPLSRIVELWSRRLLPSSDGISTIESKSKTLRRCDGRGTRKMCPGRARPRHVPTGKNSTVPWRNLDCTRNVCQHHANERGWARNLQSSRRRRSERGGRWSKKCKRCFVDVYAARWFVAALLWSSNLLAKRTITMFC